MDFLRPDPAQKASDDLCNGLQEATSNKVDELHATLQRGVVLAGVEVKSCLCLGCYKPFDGTVQATGAHTPGCLWNYILICTYCRYQNNLTKYRTAQVCICTPDPPEF